MIIHFDLPDDCKQVHFAIVCANNTEEKVQVRSGAWSVTPEDGKLYKCNSVCFRDDRAEVKEEAND